MKTTILVHAVQVGDSIYAVEFNHETRKIVTIFDVKENTFVTGNEPRIFEYLTNNIAPPMEYSQWLFKKKEDLLLLSDDEFDQWVGRVKAYCTRRRRYCEQKYPSSPMYTFQAAIMRDLYPHWTWYLCEQIKEIYDFRLIMRDGKDYRKDEACDKAKWKWEEITVATAVE